VHFTRAVVFSNMILISSCCSDFTRQEARNEYATVEKRIALLSNQLEETKAQLEATEKAYKSTHGELGEAIERINELSTANSTLQAAKRKVDTEIQTAHVRMTLSLI